jgi:formate dehydrogenase gamma subunit
MKTRVRFRPLGAALLLWISLLALVVAPSPVRAAEAVERVPNDKCLECHGLSDTTKTNAQGATISLFTDEAKLKASIHGTNTCIDCHRDLATRWEHPDDGHVAEPVNCAVCHEKQSETANAGAHGVALRGGNVSAATCKDCHGHHDIMRHTAPDSPTYFTHLAATCGQCHLQEAAELEASVHGQASAKGRRDAPTCIDCHAEHQIEDLRTASPIKIAEQICGRCHASERLNTRFRVRRTQVDTFLDSYHGLAAQGGSTRAANCASCHGWHNILASTDPASSIHPANLVKTCGQCHPGSGTNFALGRIHLDDLSGSETGLVVNRWVRRLYIALIIGVVGLLGLHNGAAWYRKIRAAYRAPGRTVQRMDRSQRRQHLILLVSFVVLAVTGFALRFPDSPLFWVLGSEDVRRWIHRLSGVVLLVLGAWHIVYLVATSEGRRLFRDMLPLWQDGKDILVNARHLAGRSPKHARFGRFGYPEKLEYWAVVWGTIIMGVTGLMIWLKIDVTRFLPRWAVDVASTIHYYEAILACLAIVVWHFYHVIFDPDVYPANWAWLDGKVTRAWHDHEHPLDTAAVTVPDSNAVAAGAPSRGSGDPAGSSGTNPPRPGRGNDPKKG